MKQLVIARDRRYLIIRREKVKSFSFAQARALFFDIRTASWYYFRRIRESV